MTEILTIITNWMLIIGILIALSIPVFTCAYIGWRLIGPARLPRKYKRRAWVGLVLSYLIMLTTFFTGRFHGNAWLHPLKHVGYLIAGFLAILLFLLMARDTIWLMLRSVDLLSHTITKRRFLPVSKDSRTHLVHLSGLAMLCLALVLLVIGYIEAYREPKLERVTITIPNLPPELDGFRIAQLSDVHMDGFVNSKDLARLVDRINKLDADVVAITGDLVEFRTEDIKSEILPIAELKARDGVFFVTGNHEYYVGADEWVEEIRRLGITVLFNEHRVIKRGNARLLLAGVPNVQGGLHGTQPVSAKGVAAILSDPAQSLRDAPDVNVKVLLAHQPASAFAARDAGFDILICGHTHGGQFFPVTLIAYLVHPFLSGLHRMDNLQVYVNRGAGVLGPPVRLGVPPEITLIELRR